MPATLPATGGWPLVAGPFSAIASELPAIIVAIIMIPFSVDIIVLQKLAHWERKARRVVRVFDLDQTIFLRWQTDPMAIRVAKTIFFIVASFFKDQAALRVT